MEKKKKRRSERARKILRRESSYESYLYSHHFPSLTLLGGWPCAGMTEAERLTNPCVYPGLTIMDSPPFDHDRMRKMRRYRDILLHSGKDPRQHSKSIDGAFVLCISFVHVAFVLIFF